MAQLAHLGPSWLIWPILGPCWASLRQLRPPSWGTLWTSWAILCASLSRFACGPPHRCWKIWGPIVGSTFVTVWLFLGSKSGHCLERLLLAIWRHFGRFHGCIGALLGDQVVQIYCRSKLGPFWEVFAATIEPNSG